MSARPKPPALARLLLRLRLGNDAVGETIRGDLWQEYVARRSQAGRIGAATWYWREALGLLRPRRSHPARTADWLAGWWQDASYAARGLRRSPGYAALAVCLLGLGIGATTAIFTVVNALFLRPPPLVAEPSRLLSIYTSDSGGAQFGVSAYPDYKVIRDRGTTFSGVSCFTLGAELQVSVDDDVRQLFGAAVSADYFDVLGVSPALGRWFAADEVGSTAVGDVIVLGHRAWIDLFDSDPEAIGRALRINGLQMTVIGVAPDGLLAPGFPIAPGAYVPLTGEELDHRGARSLSILGRMAPGVSEEESRAQLAALAMAIHEEDPRYFSDRDDNPRRISAVSEFGARLSPDTRGPAMAFVAMLFVAVSLVLAIACSNLANLALVRAGARGPDLAVRRAVGAEQSRLVRLLLLESLLVGVGGGALGVTVVAWLSALVPRLAILPQGIALELGVDWRVVVFGVAAGVVTGGLFGVVPARRLGRLDLTPVLHGGNAAGVVAGGGRWSTMLLVAQVVASVVLVGFAGLFFRSLQSALDLDIGFDPNGVAVLPVDLGPVGIESEEGLEILAAMRGEIERRPDVHATALANRVPLAGGWERDLIEIEDYVSPDGHAPQISIHRISDGYFELMRIPVVSGREFTPDDRADNLPVAVVNTVFRDTYWPGSSALGRHLSLSGVSYEVVGVVAETRARQLVEDPMTQVWLPVQQNFRPRMSLHVRTASPTPTGEFLRTVRDAARGVRPELPLPQPVWMTSMTANSTLLQRLASRVLGAAGTLALVLAAIGLHAVVAFGVSRRTREIGLRMALGADRGAVLRTVLSTALRTVALGTAAGLAIVVALGQVLRTLLLETSPIDLLGLGGPVAFLAAAALLACVGPVRRATRIDPARSLRSS